ncbi:MAG: MGMT family protein [Nanoarchaeota archaeon]
MSRIRQNKGTAHNDSRTAHDKRTAHNKTSFNERCYALLRKVPKGKVTTYKDLAHALGTRAYRAVGQAMHTNPYAPEVPCHRVVKSDGTVGGFASGTKEKIRMLEKEGIRIRNNSIEDFDKILYSFS